MNYKERQLARIMFRNQVLMATGGVYEALFTRVMQASRQTFRQVKPQGRFGDRKNDGFEPDTGRYYQVYAPEDLRARQQQTLDKIESDFQGLMAHWASAFPPGIREFYFVLNDRYLGSVFPSVHTTLERIRQEYGLGKCEPLLNKDLEDELFSLPNERIIDIVGFIPEPEHIQLLDYSLVNEVIAHVLANPIDLTAAARFDVPDFNAKIQFNDLLVAGHWLTSASYQAGSVENFFRSSSEFVRQQVREALNSHYLAVRELEIADTAQAEGVSAEDLRFMQLLHRVTPSGHSAAQTKALQEAALAVLAAFFESCDIFEDPGD